jgi:hypothetical protein
VGLSAQRICRRFMKSHRESSVRTD